MPDVLEYRLAMAGRNGSSRHLLYRPHVSDLVWEDTGERVSLAAVGMDYAKVPRDWKPAFLVSPGNPAPKSRGVRVLKIQMGLKCNYACAYCNQASRPPARVTIIPCVLHSLPYSRADDIDGVHFTDWSALTRFFDQPYFRIKVPHRVGNATLLHRTAIREFWKGDTPTADDFLEQLRSPFQLELSMKHLDVTFVQFAVSEPEIVVTPELVRTEMTTRSVSEAIGVDADKVLQAIAAISENAKALRSELERRAGGSPQSDQIVSGDP